MQNLPAEAERLDSSLFSSAETARSISVRQAYLFGRFELVPCPIGESVSGLTHLAERTYQIMDGFSSEVQSQQEHYSSPYLIIGKSIK